MAKNSKIYNCILIDAHNKTITNVTVTDANFVTDAHKLMKCDCYTHGFHLEKHKDVCLVDDEGLINGTDVFFIYKGAHQPFAGSGLVIGTRTDGETADAKSTLDEVKAKVTFKTRLEVAHMGY